MSKSDAGPVRGPKGPFTMRTRSKTAPAGTVRKHFSGKFAHLGRISNIERASHSGAVRKHFSPSSRVSNIERDVGGNIIYKRRVSSAGMPRTDTDSGRKRSSLPEPTGTSQAGLSQTEVSAPKKRRTIRSIADGQITEADNFCWLCHRDGHVVCCELCPRVYHSKCLGIETQPTGEWVCPECQKIMRAECVDTRSKSMAMITGDQLCVLLKYAVQRMKHPGSEPFQKPVDVSSLPNYKDFVVHPMDLSLIEKNIRRKVYGSTEALLADAKWILHNCTVFNGAHHKLTSSAKMVVKICRHEMTEIEICPDCYTNSCTKRNDNWFCVPCRTPHTLVWAKMKGYPFWPAKTLREVDGQLDVRFFGEHDRAWVPVSQVYLLSRQPPVEMKNTRGGYRQSMDEVQRHIDRLKEKFGSFHYASYRTPYDRKKPYISKTASKGEVSGTAKSSSETKYTVIAKDTAAPSGGSVGKNTRAKSSVKRAGEPSIVSKTASAVKSKYNSIITTRRAKALATTGETSSGQSQPVRTTSRRGNGATWRSTRGGHAKVSDSCRSAFEMTDAFALQNEATRFRPQVSLTRMSPDILRPPSGHSIVSKIEDTIKKLDALEAAGCAETVADHRKDESENSQTEREPLSNANPRSGDLKDKSGNKQMEQEKSVVAEAEKTPVVAVAAANVEATEASDARSTGEENAAPATAHETSDSPATSSKKNKYLESVVETCKAKLRVDCEESSSGTGEEGGSSTSSTSSSSSPSSGSSEDTGGVEEGDKAGKTEEPGGKQGEKTTSADAAGNKGDIEATVPQDPATAVVEKKDANSATATTSPVNIHKDPHQVGDKNTLEASHKKTSVSPPVDKAMSDAVNKQSSAKCDDSKSKVPSDKTDAKYIKPDDSTVDLEMEVDSISDSDSDPEVNDLVIDLNKKRCQDDKQLTISVDKAANEAFVIDLDKEDDQKHDIKSSDFGASSKGQKIGECVITATSRSELQSSKKPVKYKSERQKEIERQQRQLQMSGVKSSHSATVLPTSNQAPAVKRSSSFTEIRVGPPTQVQIDDDEVDDVDGILDDVVSEKRLRENVDKLDVSKYADRLMMSVRSTLQDMYLDLVNTEATKAVKRTFQLELDKIMWQHRQQLAELRQNANLTLAEMRASLECDKQKAVTELKQKMENEKQKAVNETKKKQWCAYCSKEANFYCCWNTSYCDYPCQQAAWPEHMSKCTQTRTAAAQATESASDTKPDLARQTNISHPQGDELQKDHQMAMSYTFGGSQNSVGGMNSAIPYASTLQPGNIPNVQPLQSAAQMPLQLRYPGPTPHFQQQYAQLPPGQLVGHGLPGQAGGPLLYSAVLRQPPAHTVGLTLGQSPGQLMMAPGTNILRGPMTYRPPQGY